MDIKRFWKRYEDLLIPLSCILLLFGAAGAGFDLYYDLNDDVLIRDILSGVYTGTPESRNVQMLWPLGALLALAYRLVPGTPVLGGFLWLCQAGSIYCILRRSMGLAGSTWGKLCVALTETAAIGSMLFYHFVFVQYTVTGGLLMAAAVFFFLTSDQGCHDPSADAEGALRAEEGGRDGLVPAGRCGGVGGFLWRNLPAILMALLSFLIRSEMMLLLLPLAAVAGIWKWSEERPVFTKKNVGCYLGMSGCILLGMLGALLADRAAYGSGEWKEFRELFDARTEIYDFKSAELRSYEKERAFYDSLGLSEAQCALLENYNYGISEKIDGAMLKKISAHGLQEQGYFLHTLREGVWLYRERLRDNRELGFCEMPFLLLEGTLAVLLLLAAVQRKKGRILWQLALFGGVRSILWMYLILRERVPERISHPLYFMEVGMLACLLLRMLAQGEGIHSPLQAGPGQNGKRVSGQFPRLPAFPVRIVAAVLLAVVALTGLPEEWERTALQYAVRERVNSTDRAARAYYREHPDRLYLAELMSTVDFSEKLFAEEAGFGNYDVLGGWLCKSPLMRKKLLAFGYDSMVEAVTDGNGRLVGSPEVSWDWLVDVLAEQGICGEMVKEDVIPSAGGEWYVWRYVVR